MYYACWLGLLDVLNMLIKIDDSDLTRGDNEGGNTCLHICAMFDHTELLKVVIEKMKRSGMDLNKKNKGGLTALSVAHGCSNMSCFKVLHNEGALPRLMTEDFGDTLAPVDSEAMAVAQRSEGKLSPPPAETKHITRGCDDDIPNTASRPTSGTVIKVLLERAAFLKDREVLTSDSQVPVTSEWVKSITDYRPIPTVTTPTVHIGTVLSAAMRLKSLRSKQSSDNIALIQRKSVTSASPIDEDTISGDC